MNYFPRNPPKRTIRGVSNDTDHVLGFQRISRKSVKVEFLTYLVTRSLIELKLAIFKTCSDSFNMGRVCSVLMPVVTQQSFKTIGRLIVS